MSVCRSLLVVVGMVGMVSAMPVSADAIPWRMVGHPGNAPLSNGQGSVATAFMISATEVTNASYLEFLNAVDPDGVNPNGVYQPQMGSDANGGITFSAAAVSGGKYALKPGFATVPVVYVTWFSAARFANWVSHGRLANPATMETGAYQLDDRTSGALVPRSLSAVISLPSADEWAKAAQYDGDTGGWLSWPVLANPPPNPAGNYGGTSGPVAVGSYPDSVSASGCLDMLGNVVEMTDTTDPLAAGSYQAFSGSWATPTADLNRWVAGHEPRQYRAGTASTATIGFRLVAVPEPATVRLAVAGLLALAAWAARRHGSATPCRRAAPQPRLAGAFRASDGACGGWPR